MGDLGRCVVGYRFGALQTHRRPRGLGRGLRLGEGRLAGKAAEAKGGDAVEAGDVDAVDAGDEVEDGDAEDVGVVEAGEVDAGRGVEAELVEAELVVVVVVVVVVIVVVVVVGVGADPTTELEDIADDVGVDAADCDAGGAAADAATPGAFVHHLRGVTRGSERSDTWQ